MSRKYGTVKIRSFAIDAFVLQELRTLLAARGQNLNAFVNELLREKLAELKGQPQPQLNLEYEKLKKRHVQLTEEVDRLTRLLRKRGSYEALKRWAFELGLNREGSNLDEVVPKILNGWEQQFQDTRIDVTDVNLFITLLDSAKQKRDVEEKLLKMRLQLYRG